MAAVEPLLKPFETAAPPANYKKLDASLEAFMKVHVPVEKEAGLRTRERVLGELKRIFQDWVRQVCRAKGLSDDLANEAGGRLYTSGSLQTGRPRARRGHRQRLRGPEPLHADRVL